MSKRQSLTQERLKEILHYDPETGVFTHIARRRGVMFGSRAGNVLPCGHRVLHVDQRDYRASHLAFLYMTSEWPIDQVDHINVIPDDNRWANLRQCNEGENRRNVRAYKNNTSGFKGVSRCKRTGLWRATITKDWKHVDLGRFRTPEEAHAAYSAAALQLHGEFARVT